MRYWLSNAEQSIQIAGEPLSVRVHQKQNRAAKPGFLCLGGNHRVSAFPSPVQAANISIGTWKRVANACT